MRRLLPSLLTLLLAGAVLAQNTPPTVTLELKTKSVAAGGRIEGVVHASFAEGLHGYQNPPDPDFVLPVEIVGADGTALKSVSYPKGVKETVAGILSAVYSGDVSFPVVITAPSAAGKAKISLTFKYQQCNEQTCYPPATVPLSAEVTVSAASVPLTNDVVPAGVRTASGPASFEVVPPADPVEVGKSYNVTVRITPARGLFLFTSEPGNDDLRFNGDIVRPDRSGFTQQTVAGTKGWVARGTFEDWATYTAPTTPGVQEVELTVNYLQADAKGAFQPQTKTLKFNVTVVAGAAPVTNASSATTTTQPTTNEAPAETKGGLEGFVNRALESGNWAFIIGSALLVGLALCLTPCVFPMIPVTVTFFSNQGAKTTGGRFSLGLFYALGIAATYGAVGGVSAAAGGAVGGLFKETWFVVALALLLIALALSMFDVYEIRLPGFIQKNLKGRSGPVGALIMGLLMGFAAAPCAGALVGAFAAKVAQIGSVPTGLGFFGAIGLGMGLPFMVLATMSSGAKALPRSGGWLKTTKAVLGLVVLSIAAGYLFQGFGLKPEMAATKLAWLSLYGAFALYLLFFDKSDATRAVATIKGVACVALGVLGGTALSEYNGIRFQEQLAAERAKSGATATGDGQIVGNTINWVPYNDENFAKAVASGKPIMIDGKADWCVQCHEIENNVFKTPEGLVSLSGVYLMSIDWSTGVDPAYEKMTRERFKISGLPHVVFMSPGGKDEFSVLDIKDVAELKQHLRRAGAKL